MKAIRALFVTYTYTTVVHYSGYLWVGTKILIDILTTYTLAV